MNITEQIAWFNCANGIAGDMAIAALVDAGASLDHVRTAIEALNVDGWTLKTERVMRGGFSCTYVAVDIANDPSHRHTHVHNGEEHTHHASRHYADIVNLIQHTTLSEQVKERSLKIFEVIAIAEAKLHGVDVSDVHFHEVGAMDSIIDIVGVAAALESLHIDRVYSSAVAHGTGMLRMDHGEVHNPPPATVEILANANVASIGRDIPFELTTPTGAGIVAALAENIGPMPQMTLQSSGWGAGGRDLEGTPNAVQVVIGSRVLDASSHSTSSTGRLVNIALLETNIDDCTAEELSFVLNRALELGAMDAWLTPITMKKSRAAYTLSVLCGNEIQGTLLDLIAKETGTLGIRCSQTQRWESDRAIEAFEIDGQIVRIKIGSHQIKPEFDDVSAFAHARNLSFREARALILQSWNTSSATLSS